MEQLKPLFDVSLSVKGITNKKVVVSHPNGNLINDIITEKLKEEMDTPIPNNIQGQEMGNEFSYDKVHTAALNANDPNTSQSAVSVKITSLMNDYDKKVPILLYYRLSCTPNLQLLFTFAL